MGVVSMVMDHCAADDDVSQLTQDIEKNSRFNSYTPPTAEERDSGERTMGVVSMVMDHCAADDDVSQLTQDIEKNSRFNSYTPYQRLLCGKLFSFVQVLVVHLMSWLAHLAEPMLCLFLRAALLGRTNRLAAIESDSLTP
jgi:hypothetical protein